jgi:hypothetical protein
MPSIEMYLDVPDLLVIQEFLNADKEIVFVVPSEHGSYLTTKPIALQANAGYTMWHVPSGDIPRDCLNPDGKIVADPWAKWHVGAIRLRLEVCPGKYQTFVPMSSGRGYDLAMFQDGSAIGRSSFDWVGNKFSVIGKKANPGTVRWWQRLRRWVSKKAQKVASYGPLQSKGSSLEVWAFPAAYEALSCRRARSINPVLRGTTSLG